MYCLYERDRKTGKDNDFIKKNRFYKRFSKFYRNDFITEITNEGCKSNLIIKTVNIEEDK